MGRKADCVGLWNTGQGTLRILTTSWLLLLFTSPALCRPDFLDSMSRQFFGLSDNQQQPSQHAPPQQADPFSQMFQNQPPPAPRPPPPPPRHHRPPPQRQGYYIPQQQVHHPHYPPVAAVKHHPHPHHHHPPHPHPEQPLYNGPPAVQGHQQGFGEVKPDGNETKTEGFPRDSHQKPGYEVQKHHHAVEYQQPRYEVVQKHHHAVEYQHPEYPQHQPVEYHQPHQVVEYHHPPEVVEEHHAVEYQPDPHHHHEAPVEYHHQPPVEYHHYPPPPHKPKPFHISFSQPSPDLKIIDKHLKLPAVKFRFHINPKIVITSNTKDPLDKKHHHDDEHDLEPYPPPDAFSQHDGPPQYNEHTINHYDVGHHHYPAHHEVVEHHGYPVEHHHGAPHYPPPQEFAYDLSRGHSHVNPHRSYDPTFKVKTRPIIFTEAPPPPTMRTTRTTRATTRRTTTPRTTTTTTTTARPRSRSRASQNARNPGFSVAFTQSPTTPIERQGDVTEASTTTTTTRRSTFTTNSERERENGGISARRDDQSSSSATAASTTTSTTTTTTTTPRPTTTTTTTTTPRPTTASTTTTTTTTTTTPRPTTTSTTTTTTPRPTTTTSTTPRPTSSSPPEDTTARMTTPLNVGSNEIDMRKVTTPPRSRPEPLTEVIERSESFDFKNSESVKVVETTMLIDGKNQTVRFYYVTQPVKLPLDVFQKMTGQKLGSSGVSVIKLRDKRFVAAQLDELAPVLNA